MSRAPHAPMFVREMGLSARFALYALVSLVLMGVDSRYDTLTVLRTGVAGVVHPLQAALARPFLFLAEAGEFFTIHGELLAGNRRLEAERQRLAAQLQNYHSLATENDHLRRLLALAPQEGTEAQAAEVIHALPDPFARKLILNRGAHHGVAAGRPVIDADGLVGQITHVYPVSSELTLVTSREQSVPVQVLRNGLRLIVTGAGNDNTLEVRFLDAHADVQAGDLLLTSGIDGVYPVGIPVARVQRVEPPRNSPFARATCLPLGGVNQHRQLTVLRLKPVAPPPASVEAPPSPEPSARP